MSKYAEKRDYQRMAIDCVLNFSSKGNAEVYRGNVINLSSKGILFTSMEALKENSELQILLTPSNSITPPMEADAIVKRVKENQPAFEIACTIINIH